MVIIIADEFSAYQQKRFKLTMKRLDLDLHLCSKSSYTADELEKVYNDRNTLVIIISPSASTIATSLIKLHPSLQVRTFPIHIDKVIGFTKITDIKIGTTPERQQIKKILIDYARQVHRLPNERVIEMPLDIFQAGGDEMISWIDEHQDYELITCQLSDEIVISIYNKKAPGWRQLELTCQEANVLANIMKDFNAKIIAVKDGSGTEFRLNAS
jgi:hypothetical protein